MLCLYFMGLNLSNEQIAHELDLNSDDAQKMTTQLREGIVERKPKVTLSGEVECDEVYPGLALRVVYPSALSQPAIPYKGFLPDAPKRYSRVKNWLMLDG